MELLKDVQSKKDLIIRLVTHDIDQEILENEESLSSDEDEVVLQEVVKEEFPEDPFEDQVKEDVKSIANTVAFPKPQKSKSNLKKILSLEKCYNPRYSVITTNIETSPTQWTESKETQMGRIVPKANVTTSKSLTDADSSFWEKKTQLSVSEKCDYQWVSTEKLEFYKLSPSNVDWVGIKGINWIQAVASNSDDIYNKGK